MVGVEGILEVDEDEVERMVTIIITINLESNCSLIIVNWEVSEEEGSTKTAI